MLGKLTCLTLISTSMRLCGGIDEILVSCITVIYWCFDDCMIQRIQDPSHHRLHLEEEGPRTGHESI